MYSMKKARHIPNKRFDMPTATTFNSILGLTRRLETSGCAAISIPQLFNLESFCSTPSNSNLMSIIFLLTSTGLKPSVVSFPALNNLLYVANKSGDDLLMVHFFYNYLILYHN